MAQESGPAAPAAAALESEITDQRDAGNLASLTDPSMLEGLQTITSSSIEAAPTEAIPEDSVEAIEAATEEPAQEGEPQGEAQPSLESEPAAPVHVASVPEAPQAAAPTPSLTATVAAESQDDMEEPAPRSAAPEVEAEESAPDAAKRLQPPPGPPRRSVVSQSPPIRKTPPRKVARREPLQRSALATPRGYVAAEQPRDPALRRQQARRHFMRGLSAHRLRQVTVAAAEYQRALWLDANRVDAWNNFGVLMRNHGRLGRALSAYQQAVRLQPNFGRARHNLGEIYFLLRDYPSSLREYERVLKLEHGSVETYLNLAATYRHLGRYRDAERTLNDVLRRNPTQPEVHYNLARLYELKGQRELAITSYQNFFRVGGERFGALAERVRRHLTTLTKQAG